eukprot:2993260-Prorocentrum_lima.AAC.1
MTSSLVGSEMCIRDSTERHHTHRHTEPGVGVKRPSGTAHGVKQCERNKTCLLYTSDAADDM